MRRRRRLGEILVESLRPDGGHVPRNPAGPGSVDLDGLAELAEFHRVSPAAYLRLRDVQDIPEAVLAPLVGAYHRAVRTHLFALRDLDFVSKALRSLSAPWLVVKGPVLSEAVYSRPDLRMYEDLDIVVPGPALGEALELLEGLGATVADQNWRLVNETMRGELHVLLPSGGLVDLHWHLLNDSTLRTCFDIPMEDIFASARLVEVAGRRVATLGQVDTLVHLALHASMAGANRLIWLKDIEQVVLNESFDWDLLVRRAREWSAGPAVAGLLVRTRRTLGLEVPVGVVPALAGGSTWPWLVATADHLWPVASTGWDRSPGRILARSARRDASSSVVELGRRTMAWVRSGTPTGNLPPGPDARPHSPSSLHWADGGEASKAAFLRALAEPVTTQR